MAQKLNQFSIENKEKEKILTLQEGNTIVHRGKYKLISPMNFHQKLWWQEDIEHNSFLREKKMSTQKPISSKNIFQA